ncbi:MAG: alpha/beta hydrolase [Cyclobacteriaceae bacterium]
MNKHITMKNFTVFFFVIGSHIGLSQNVILPLYEGQVPNSKETSVTEEVKITNATRISNVIDPTIEVYLPSKLNSIRKAVVICPGGGYKILAYDFEGTDIAKWLNGHGIAGIVLKYRLPEDHSNIEPHMSPLMDAQQAMKLARANAEEWGYDTDKIGVMGFSAGGHLASTLGTHFDDQSRPDFMVLMYPVVTMKKDYTHMGSRNNLLGPNPSESLVELYSNELQVTENTPPTFIVHSEDDGAVPVENSLQLYQALRDNKVPTEMHLFPYGGHGYSLAVERGRLFTWREMLIHWINDL